MKPMLACRRRRRADRVAASVRLARAVGLVEPLEDRRLLSVALATPVTTPLSAAPTGDPAAPVVADFNRDGRPDVVVAFPAATAIDTGFVQAGRGDGTGTFALAAAVDVGRFTGRPVVGDFDGDDLPDLAVTDAFGGQVKVLRNTTEVGGDNGGATTAITFAPAVSFAAGVSPEALAVADFNNDGWDDLAVGNRSDNTVQVRPGTGPGTGLLGAPATINTAADPASLAVGDFNLDDAVDLLVGASGGAEATAGTLQVFAGNGDGTFNNAPIATVGPRGVTAVGDINDDGALDVIVGVDDQDRADALVNNGNGTFTLAAGSTGTGATKAAVLADLDENRRPEVVTAVAGQIDVLPGTGTGTFDRPLAFDAAGGSGPAVADVNGDGRADVLTVTATPGTATGRTLNVSIGQRVGPDLTVQIVSALPPAALVGGRGQVTVRVTNTGAEAVNGPVLLQLLASTDATYDELDPLLLQTSPKLKLRTGRAKNIKLKFNYEADAATYNLAARVDPFATTSDVNPANNTAVAPTQVTVAQPFVDLSGTIPAAPATLAVGQKGTVSMVVTSAGNVVASGRLSLVLTASLDQAPGANDPVIRTVSTRVKLSPGASKTFRFKFRVPEDVPPGTYSLLGVIDPADTVLESDEANNVAVSPTTVTITPRA